MTVVSEDRRPLLVAGSLKAFLNRSPEDTCSAPKSLANHFDIVPFPEAFKNKINKYDDYLVRVVRLLQLKMFV